MAGTYLTTAFKDKDRVKSLGARWDSERKSWYVPEGLDLAPFAAWLPVSRMRDSEIPETALSTSSAAPSESALVTRQGQSLSQLLQGVSQVVAAAYKTGVWTRVEVVKVDVRRGHVYLELTERSPEGGTMAQARAMIWAGTANTIVPQFEQATGVILGPGIKLLVRARPTVHAQYGLSLAIDGIDPEYTLGDLEARKREIRERLKSEGLFDLNRQLPPPWDYNAVLVVAPEGAAGLGDFAAEARRLTQHGLCRFVYAYSRFQGEGAASEIRAALLDTLDRWQASEPVRPDAVAIIRGGGAVNDLAWLNDYGLARCLCELDVPVLTGIGHERDNTVLDEVAHQRFDTPSKVIVGIEQRIRQRADEARSTFEAIARAAGQHLQGARQVLERHLGAVQLASRQGVVAAARAVEQDLASVRLHAVEQVGKAAERSAEAIAQVRTRALQDLSTARASVQAHFGTVRIEATDTIAEARAATRLNVETVLGQSVHQARMAGQTVDHAIGEVAERARRAVTTARDTTESLMREVAGQGPEKTLGRGFAVVRTAAGQTLTQASQATAEQAIRVQFSDGTIEAITTKTGGTP